VTEEPTREPVVVVHQAGSWTEAVVIRGLLRSAGIESPASTTTDPFPMREPPKGTHGVEILVLESQAEDARRLIDEHLTGTKGMESPGLDSEQPSSS